MLNNNIITRQVEEYIEYKRSLGYIIKIEAQELRRFAKYTKSIDYNGSINVDLAVRWASLSENYSQLYMARRLETLYTFAVYISAFDPNAQIPQKGIFGKAHQRTRPYIYTEDEVLTLMNETKNLFSPDEIRSRTLFTAIGLMYSTGIRVSELTSLRLRNVNLNEGYLFICCSKFKRDRIVPLHLTVVRELENYFNFISSKIPYRNDSEYFFVTSYGHRFNSRAFEYAFQLIRPIIFKDRQIPIDRRSPRLYDLRHTFACNTIKRWFESEEDVNQKLYQLSTYMGHVKPEDTYWYLSATPELLGISSRRFENKFGGIK